MPAEVQNVAIGVFTLVVLYILYTVMTASTLAWSEWVLQGTIPTCGSGTSVYKRQCTLNSLAQSTIDACVVAFGGSDTKSETYSLANKCPIAGRYVILERNSTSSQSGGDGDVLNIAEIKVYDLTGNNLIVSGVTAAAGSNYSTSSFPASNLIDNKLDNFAHTSASDKSKNWFKIDLGSDKIIGKIEIYNRKNCCWARTAGARVRITDSAGVTTFTSPDVTAAQATDASRLISFNIA